MEAVVLEVVGHMVVVFLEVVVHIVLEVVDHKVVVGQIEIVNFAHKYDYFDSLLNM
jgi:hypothetical protein